MIHTRIFLLFAIRTHELLSKILVSRRQPPMNELHQRFLSRIRLLFDIFGVEFPFDVLNCRIIPMVFPHQKFFSVFFPASSPNRVNVVVWDILPVDITC